MLALLLFVTCQNHATLSPLPKGATQLGSITAIAAHEQLVLIQALTGPADMSLYRVNLESQVIERVEGTGLPKTIYRLMPMKKGFAVFGHLVNRIYELDETATVLAQRELADYSGALPGMVVSELFAWTPGTALLTFETEDSDAVFLARLDLENHALEILGNFPSAGEGSFQFAYPGQSNFLLCDKTSGRVQWITADGKPVGPLLQEPLPLEKTAQFGESNAQDKLSSRLKYRARLTDPLPCSDGLSFSLTTRFPTNTLPELRNTRLASTAGQTMRSVDLLTLHRHSGKRLILDLVSGHLMFLRD